MKKSLADIKKSGNKKASKQHRFGAFTAIDNKEAKIDLERVRENSNIFFATPCYGGLVTDQYFLSMFKTSQELMRTGISFRLTTLRNESLITRARNSLVAMFLASECTHLMFIDADIEFQPKDIIRALAYEKPIIVGAYPKKHLDKEAIRQGKTGALYAVNFKIYDTKENKIRVENGLAEVHDASTGFFMIHRDVIEKMIKEYPELHYKNDSNLDPKLNKHMYALFDTGIDPEDNRYLSEDYYFCRLWQKLGGEIWLDLNTKLNHVGSHTHEGDVSELLGNFNNIVTTR